MNILESVQSLPLTTQQFQQTQTILTYQNLLNHAPIGCDFEDGLAELLTGFRLGVVLDKHTSWSRTTWLAGVIETSPILIVLDTTNIESINRASIDIWTNIEEMPDTVLRRVQESRMGSVPDAYSSLEISWGINSEGLSPKLQVTLAAPNNPSGKGAGEIFFSIDYQGSISEIFKTTYPVQEEQVSIDIDLGSKKSKWSGSLDDSFLTLFFSDADWKSNNRLYQMNFTWKDALVRQLERSLSRGDRLEDFSEVSQRINLEDTPDAKNAKNLFFTLCLGLVVEGCTSQRVSDHCRRCVVLTGLVICFNPKRGLTGYLEMVMDGPDELTQLGSERTWRDHLSHIVSAAGDFKPMRVELKGKRRARGPGRPPKQLIPTKPPLKLFHDFTNDPESIVCRYCRFSNDVD
jgi:hypothetical protein